MKSYKFDPKLSPSPLCQVLCHTKKAIFPPGLFSVTKVLTPSPFLCYIIYECPFSPWKGKALKHIFYQGLILSTKIWVLRNFLTKIWKFWTHQFFQTKYYGTSGWTDFWKFSFEYFYWNNTFWKSKKIFRNLRILSELREFFCW